MPHVYLVSSGTHYVSLGCTRARLRSTDLWPNPLEKASLSGSPSNYEAHIQSLLCTDQCMAITRLRWLTRLGEKAHQSCLINARWVADTAAHMWKGTDIAEAFWSGVHRADTWSRPWKIVRIVIAKKGTGHFREGAWWQQGGLGFDK